MSVINKMLNDLDERNTAEQAQDEVAFLTPVAKPKRKWLMILLSSIVLGLGAIWGSYYFYHDLLALVGTKKSKQPQFLTAEQMQARIDADEAAKQAGQQPTLAADANLSAETQGENAPLQTEADTPELIILTPAEADKAKPRPSTLKVVAVEANQASGNDAQLPGAQVAKSAQPATSDEIAADIQTNSTPSDIPSTEPVLDAEDEVLRSAAAQPKVAKMQVSKVQASPQQRAEKAYHQAKELSKGGMIVEAIEKYREVLRFDPSNQQGRSELAALYYGRNMTLEALTVLDQGLDLDPSNLGWSLLAAKIHYKRTNYAGALAYLQQPVETYDQIEYVALKATTAYKLKAYEEAQDAYQKLTVADPGNGRWWLGLGTTFEAMGDEQAAIVAYRKSLRLANISTSSRQFVMSRLQRLAN